jgi:antitoxin CcdA
MSLSPHPSSSPRRSLNLSIPEHLIEEARRMKLNLSRFLEDKLNESLRAERARRWQEENKEAIEYQRRRIERDGPLNADLISF